MMFLTILVTLVVSDNWGCSEEEYARGCKLRGFEGKCVCPPCMDGIADVPYIDSYAQSTREKCQALAFDYGGTSYAWGLNGEGCYTYKQVVDVKTAKATSGSGKWVTCSPMPRELAVGLRDPNNHQECLDIGNGNDCASCCMVWFAPYGTVDTCFDKCTAKYPLRNSRTGEEKAVADPYYQYHGPQRDCYSFQQNCQGCRGYLDSCCKTSNCGKRRDGKSLYCKAGIYSYSCDIQEEAVGCDNYCLKKTGSYDYCGCPRESGVEGSLAYTKAQSNLTWVTYGLAAIGMGSLLYGAGSFYLKA